MAAPNTCRICGCTQNNACMTADGPCHWIETRLCSAPACAVHARKLTDADAFLLLKMGEAHRTVLLATGSYVERAAQMKVAVGTIKSRVNRSRAVLAKMRAEAQEQAA